MQMLFVFGVLTLLLAGLVPPALAGKTRNMVLIVSDGLRWQESVTQVQIAATIAALMGKDYVKDVPSAAPPVADVLKGK